MWTSQKVADMFNGLYDCLYFSVRHGLGKLHCSVCNKLNSYTFQNAVANTITDVKVREVVVKTLKMVDFSILAMNNVTFCYCDLYSALLKDSTTQCLVTVIIPIYNVEKYLNRCLDSVINQTITNIEILCINDGSRDRSLEILKTYEKRDNRIKIINKNNGGLSSARNVGIKYAIGNYIMFVDSDDYIAHDTLEKAISRMICEVDVVSWGANIINEGLDELSEGLHRTQNYHRIRLSGQKKVTNDVIKQCTFTVWNKLFKKSIIDTYGLNFIEGRLFEDNDFTIKYLVHCRNIYFIDEYLYNYVQRPNSIMEQVRDYKCIDTVDHLYIFDSIYKHLIEYDIAKNWSELLTLRYASHLSQAYRYAPKSERAKIREVASLLAGEYDETLFVCTQTIQNIKKKNYSKVRELNEVIVSLTSYPKRIKKVHLTIMSIIGQITKPDRIILWLSNTQFPNLEKQLPEELLKLKSYGLQIEWCEDLRSYKKLIPTLKLFPESVIIR